MVFANHPSWWDGVAFMLYSTELLPGRRMFIPMEAAALQRYGFMRRHRRLRGGAAGGARRGGLPADAPRSVLAEPGAMLWMNAPGRFMDVRERPVPMAPGLVRLAEYAPDARFLPMAIEYPFWSERAAEMLCGFGPPIEGPRLAALDREARGEALARALEATMDRLAEDAMARDPAVSVPCCAAATAWAASTSGGGISWP